MKTVLVVANETLGGLGLLEKARELAAEEGGLRVIVCVPRSRPRHGNVIYDDAVLPGRAGAHRPRPRRSCAQEGIDAVGEVGDPDPYTATMDAILEHDPDEVIVSTLPGHDLGLAAARPRSSASPTPPGCPVHHIVPTSTPRACPSRSRSSSPTARASTPELLSRLRERAGDEPHRHLFIAVVPQEGGEGVDAAARRARGWPSSSTACAPRACSRPG